MANNTLKARLIQASKTEAEWKSSNPVLLKGEVAYSSDKKQRKTGDGSSKWTDITYDKSVPTEHTHNYAGSSSAGGVANSANKLATPRKINGIAFDGTKDINNVIYTTKKDYDTLVKTGTYDKSAMYVTTDEIDDMSKFNTDLLDSSTSLAKQGKYLSYSDQNGGKYLSIKNTTDNSTVAHAKLMDGESGEGMDVDADKVKTIDSKGILVDALGETTAQALIDEVAKRVIDLTGRMSTTETGLQSANEAITSLNSNMKKNVLVQSFYSDEGTYSSGQKVIVPIQIPDGYNIVGTVGLQSCGFLASAYAFLGTTSLDVWIASGGGTGRYEVRVLFVAK